MKLNKVLLNISAFFCFIIGAIYIFSLVFIPVGVYCFIAGRIFSKKADHLLDDFQVEKKTMLAYSIFSSIACFPIGLLSLIAYFRLYGNNVKVQQGEFIKINTIEEVDVKDVVEELKTEDAKETEETSEYTEEEKMEKIEKLRKFKEKNIISEEEFEMAKEQIYKKNK